MTGRERFDMLVKVGKLRGFASYFKEKLKGGDEACRQLRLSHN